MQEKRTNRESVTNTLAVFSLVFLFVGFVILLLDFILYPRTGFGSYVLVGETSAYYKLMLNAERLLLSLSILFGIVGMFSKKISIARISIIFGIILIILSFVLYYSPYGKWVN